MKLVLATHPDSDYAPDIAKKYIRFGASPRGAQAIMNAARIRSILEGRYNVAFEDIKFAAYPSLRHRIFVNFEGMSEGIVPDTIIGEIIKEVGK
jgi:MoxR-like ATPase